MRKIRSTSRLRSLYSIEILDTPPDERFDRITRIAAKIFTVPVALVSLVDIDRQWFKSSFGFDERSTGINDSFCSLAVESEKPLIVNDTINDARFNENKYVLNPPFIRFYAGYPVRLPDGEIAGAICLIDTKSRIFTEHDMVLLRDLAGIIEDELHINSLATTDSLTNIFNRRSFMLILNDTYKKHRRKNKLFCLIIIDLNDFKIINDEFGHAEGNAALCDFSSVLESVSNENSFVARLGGGTNSVSCCLILTLLKLRSLFHLSMMKLDIITTHPENNIL